MNSSLLYKVSQRLLQDFSFKEKGDYFQQGTCPSCHKKELYTHAASPWLLHCNRANKCGEVFHIKDLYPDLFHSYSDIYPKTPDNPHASADAYLENARGFKLSELKGIYSQESFYDHQTKKGSATVRFPISDDCYWERLIDKAHEFNRKANFDGKYQGLVWSHPDDDFKDVKEIWITEGIFDAIALRQAGYSAVSILTCSNYPEHFLEGLKATNPDATLIFALDTDKAGRKFTKSHAKKAIENGWTATAAQPPSSKKKLDWNELLQLEKLAPSDIDTYKYYGKLLLAKSANEKASLMHEKLGKHEFHFDFDSALFYFKLDLDKFQKALDAIYDREPSLDTTEAQAQALIEAKIVTEICNCKPTPLYYQRNELTDDSWYYFQVDFSHGRQIKNTFTAKQLAKSSEFKQRLLHIAPGGLWQGNNNQLDSFIKQQQIKNIKTVDTVAYIGYSRIHKAYVFNECAIHNGKLLMVNAEDYFDVGKAGVKSLDKSVEIYPNTDLKNYDDSWVANLYNAWFEKGLIALTYWFGSLFAEQIRDIDESFPFFEIVGIGDSGKSTLLEFLWKLLGREKYEGFDASNSSFVGRARTFAQVSNLPIVLIEGDREEKDHNKRKAFDLNELKPLYNGRSIRTIGVMTKGNETYSPQFRGSIVISQNANVEASPEVLQRIVYLYIDKKSQTKQTQILAQKLFRMPIKNVSGFILKATMAEQKILSMFMEKRIVYQEILENTEGLRHSRIIKTHSQMLALLDCLSLIIPLEESWVTRTQTMLVEMAKKRHFVINSDTPSVQIFWEIYEFLIMQNCQLNHTTKTQHIAINLNEFYQKAIDWRQPMPSLTELKKQLKQSVKYKYVEQKQVKSVHLKKPIRCYIFKDEN